MGHSKPTTAELNRLGNLIQLVCQEFKGILVASDTHRWVESDGFYEVQFMIKFPDHTEYKSEESGIYIHNVKGKKELQEQWSKNNPQRVRFVVIRGLFKDSFDVKYAATMVAKFIDDEKWQPSDKLTEILNSVANVNINH